MPVNMTKEEQWLLQEKYSGIDNDAFVADRKRLRAGEPLGYVIGWVPFLDCRIHLDSHPLIPRPETEYWTEKVIDVIRTTRTQLPRSSGVLDLCAGSGCIGVAVAHALPELCVDFAELIPQHLPTIEKNLKENLPDYSNRMEYYRVLQSDLFRHITEHYDYILCNPPYIDPVLDRAEASVKAHEPHEALYSGDGGLELIERIIKEASQHLTAAGQLWLEHEPEQSKQIQKLAAKYCFTVTTHSDQYDVERYSVLVLE